MKKASSGVVVALTLAVVGCGGAPGPEDFVGLYRGSGTTRYVHTTRGYVDEDLRQDWNTGLSASADGEKLLLSDYCRLKADVVDEHTFEVNAVDCPTRQGTSCDLVERVKTGKGTLSEDRMTLTLVFTGDSVQTHCVKPNDDGTWSYTTQLKLTRQ